MKRYNITPHIAEGIIQTDESLPGRKTTGCTIKITEASNGKWVKYDDANDAITVRIVSALCHLVEFHDTGEPFDIAAYASLMTAPDVQEWLRANEVLLPARRDGRPQLEP